METIFKSNFCAISIKLGTRAIVPSSFKISTITPASSNPAKRDKSTAASVCPARRKTPPLRARNGKMCPGFPNSSGRIVGSIKAKIVLERSLAEIPVVHPCPIKSMLTVKGVSYAAELLCTIISNPKASQRSSLIGAQIKPRPCVAMKLMTSGVAFLAAVKKSPSFSRPSSSTTMTTRPCWISEMASSIVFN